VTQPRLPCFKLGLRFGRDDMVRRFLASGRQGVYFKVVTEGEVATDDPIVVVDWAEDSVPISEVTRLYARDKDDLEGLGRIVEVAALPTDWRDYFEEQIRQVTARGQSGRARTPA
jgi:MOSC domain-containing protein YiiM